MVTNIPTQRAMKIPYYVASRANQELQDRNNSLINKDFFTPNGNDEQPPFNITPEMVQTGQPPQAETPEQKVDRYVQQSQKRLKQYREQSNQEVADNKQERTDNEDTTNLGRTLGTLLGHVMSGGHAQRTGMVIPPTIAAASKGEELNKLLGTKDMEEHNIALKSYMSSLLKGQDFFKSLELEKQKQEGATERERIKASGEKLTHNLVLGRDGKYHMVAFNPKDGSYNESDTGLEGKDPNALTPSQKLSEQRLTDSEKRQRTNQLSKSKDEIQKIRTKMQANDLNITKLASGDETKKQEALTALSGVDKKYEGLTANQALHLLTQEQIQHEGDIKNWKYSANEVEPSVKAEGDDFYTRQEAGDQKDPLGRKKKY